MLSLLVGSMASDNFDFEEWPIAIDDGELFLTIKSPFFDFTRAATQRSLCTLFSEAREIHF